MSELSDKYDSLKSTGSRKVREDTYKVSNLHKSYLKLRRAIGYLGILLPISLVLLSLLNRNGCEWILPSISDYYHTSVGGIFTGILVSIAIFLWYNGESKQEKIICRIASGLAIIIAFAPTPINENYIITESSILDLDFVSGCYIPKPKGIPLVGGLHFFCAAVFFLLLSYLSGIVFRKDESPEVDEGKKRRLIYLICSLGMLLYLILIAVFEFFLVEKFPNSDNWMLPPTFTLETIMLFCFGIAWLVRGEVTFQNIQSFFEEGN